MGLMKRLILLIFTFFIVLAPSAFSKKLQVLTIDNHIINPAIQEYIEDNLEKAESGNYAAVIIRINTPGGLLKPTQNIVKSILNSEIPVITYVWPKASRAASAGIFIGYASSVLAMTPSTHIGAAHPVLGQGSWGEIPEKMKEKIMNDTLAWAKNISKERNRPFEPLKKMIEKSSSFTDKEAKENKITDLIAGDLNELIKKTNNKEIKWKGKNLTLPEEKSAFEFIKLTPRQKILNALLTPKLAYLLFTLGTLGLIFEVTHPGFGFPGIAGLISIVIALYAFSALPVNYAGIALIILGIIFLIAEAFTPSFGLFAASGLTSFILGSLFMFRGTAGFKIPLSFILPLAAVIGVWNVFVLGKIIQIRIKRPQTGTEGLIGKEGQAHTDIKEKGKVFIHGELWNAKSKKQISQGESVEVTKVNGMTLEVKKKEE